MKVSAGSYSSRFFLRLLVFSLFFVFALSPYALGQPAFDIKKISDMSDFDATTFKNPTGDTFKIGLIEAFSGASAFNGQLYWLVNTWIAHDFNKRGGILVDGKKKMIEIVKGDHQAKPAVTKKVAEKLCLEDKVNVLWGTAGSHLTLIVQQVAAQYKTIFMNPMSLTDALMDGKNFNRYTFRTTITTTQFGYAMAYYYSKRAEKKFYILCQDYMFGHEIAKAFKDGLKKYKPEAEIVGEAFHPLFMTDFAPYLTKVQGSGAEVIYTGDWSPDADNFLKQARSMGITLPIANIYMDAPGIQQAVGGAGGRGMVNVNDHHMTIDTPEMNQFIKIWHKAWEKWKEPYNTVMWEYPLGAGAKTLNVSYWMMDVIERAASTDPEKIIKVWEGDTYKSLNGSVHMRACDHQVVRDMYAAEYIFPNQFYKDAAAPGKPFVIPAQFCMPAIPADLDRCKK
jgi:branched-chain amino acid transport system substrate-binding protein